MKHAIHSRIACCPRVNQASSPAAQAVASEILSKGGNQRGSGARVPAPRRPQCPPPGHLPGRAPRRPKWRVFGHRGIKKNWTVPHEVGWVCGRPCAAASKCLWTLHAAHSAPRSVSIATRGVTSECLYCSAQCAVRYAVRYAVQCARHAALHGQTRQGVELVSVFILHHCARVLLGLWG